MTTRYVDPLAEIGECFLKIDKPARYTGGEAGILADKNAFFQTLIAFPDLYEIGMGNHALRVIYNNLNLIDNISCDRAFAPAPDFENLLREKKIPLYGLDTGISLKSLDMLMFTLGYEPGLNGIFTMLDVSGIPLRREDRKASPGEYPLIIAGGPAVSNPMPYSPYIDAFWIGEAEAGFFTLVHELAELKKTRKGRGALLEKISSHPAVWVKGKERAVRAVHSGFTRGEKPAKDISLVYPVPSMKIVQNHGTVEIMRGCPNGCRFCHAGFWYKPARQKSREQICFEVDELVKKGGWHEISLSSLSSGDYLGIGELIEKLNNEYGCLHVSFQLPSLKVDSFSLDLLEKISVTRKSGLTFAVETPRDMHQIAVNKAVTRDSIAAILNEAKKRGWKSAKFYFMIGLPLEGTSGGDRGSGIGDRGSVFETVKCSYREEEEIVEFIIDIARRSRMHFNINIGIFIPKPHTPYQWASQIDGETAFEKLSFIRSKLKPLGHKVSFSDPLISRIEGMMSRGDERSGFLCEEAWREGSRLDAWDEFINREKWREILDRNADYCSLIFSGKIDPLPWSSIDSRVTLEYLKRELERSNNPCRTESCRDKCSQCGVCTAGISPRSCFPETCTNQYEQNLKVKQPEIPGTTVNHGESVVNGISGKQDPSVFRMLLSFSKKGSAVLHGHLSLIEIFSMSLRRAGIPVLYTQGFNPLAKMEFASPLSTGISADNETAVVNFHDYYVPNDFIQKLNLHLPQGIEIKKAECFLIKSRMKKHSLSSLLWGSVYARYEGMDYINSSDEKAYRQSRLEKDCASVFHLRRVDVLARNITGGADEWASYFDIYRHLYPHQPCK